MAKEVQITLHLALHSLGKYHIKQSYRQEFIAEELSLESVLCA